MTMPRPSLPVIATAVVAALLGLILVVPAVMDWTRLQPEIEAAMSASLGRKATITGPISVRLLPSPQATISGITLGDASAQSLRVGLRLLPLLAGRREIDAMTLTGGRIGPVETIEAHVTPAGDIAATGRASLPQGGSASLIFNGRTDFRSASGTLRLTAARLTVESSLSLSQDEISLPDMVIALGQSRASASVVASLGTSPILIDATVKAGGIDLDAPAPQPAAAPSPTAQPQAPAAAPIAAQPSPPSPAGGFALPSNITANLTITADSLRWHGVFLSRIEISALLDNAILSLGHAKAQVQDSGTAELTGTLTAKDGQPAFDGSLRATTSRAGLTSPVSLRGALLKLSSVALAVDDIHATGEAAITLESPLTIKTHLSALGLDAGFDGKVEGTHANGMASLRAASFAQAARLLSGSYRPRSTGPLTITAHLDTTDADTAFDQLQARLGEAVLTGRGKVTLGTDLSLTADLTAANIALAPFLPAESKPFGLNAWKLENASAHIALAKGLTTLEHFSGRLLGGDLTGSGWANTTGMAGGFAIRGADIGGLELGSGGIKATKGRLNGQAKLSGSPSQLPSLNGDGRFEIKDGVVEGFDLAAMDAQMRRLENIGSLLGLVQTGLSGGKSRFSSLSASFRTERGVVTSRDIKLDAEGGGATGTAIIDLPKDIIDARFAFKLATPDSPPLGLRLEGKLGAPNKIIDINALQRYLVEHGLGKGLKEKGRGLLESLLGVKPRQKQ